MFLITKSNSLLATALGSKSATTYGRDCSSRTAWLALYLLNCKNCSSGCYDKSCDTCKRSDGLPSELRQTPELGGHLTHSRALAGRQVSGMAGGTASDWVQIGSAPGPSCGRALPGRRDDARAPNMVKIDVVQRWRKAARAAAHCRTRRHGAARRPTRMTCRGPLSVGELGDGGISN